MVACGREPDPTTPRHDGAEQAEAASRTVADTELASYQRDLLTLAFDAASKFPSDPHSKNRGLAQEQVLSACFELGVPKLALMFAPRAEGWRRGLAYADFAYFSARQGVTENVERYLEMARNVADEEGKDPNAQQWRIDKIRLKMARALSALGRTKEAGDLSGGIDATSRGAVDEGWSDTVTSTVLQMTLDDAKRELESVTAAFSNMSLGEQYSTLLILGGIHGRFFSDEGLRAATAERILNRFFKLPANLRLDAMAPLVGNHVAHGDVDGARDVIVEMAKLVAETTWRPEDKLPQLVRLAELRVDTNEDERARQELARALSLFQESRDEIFDIYRSKALRSVALGFYKVGDEAQAADLLAVAVEEGMQNPNSRPRCFDLVGTCVALAKRGVEPSPELMARLREIADQLGAPW
ncbi:MAG: hypothetical protein VYA51_06430 [Planctomycetota bacterium]|nr:hypothetical protein [Planctomycetota bacterium]